MSQLNDRQRPKTPGFIPWPDMMRVGLRLGLTPKGFWSLSLKEWRWLAAPKMAAGLPADGLVSLMTTFPDVAPIADNDPHEVYETKDIIDD